MNDTRQRTDGFSLVELSIVLVILGLLVGGVLAGQSLIRAAQIRAVITELNRYSTAAKSFKDKYFAIPGDMANATAFWGKDNTNCSGNTGTAATPGTCNGDGDGVLVYAYGGANTTGEYYQFWKQLALAGLIEGTYTGLSGPGSSIHFVAGVNSPASRIPNATWSTIYRTPAYNAYEIGFDGDFGNALEIGTSVPGSYGHNPILKPEEAWNIDTKLDDGKPGTGAVRALEQSGSWNCTTAANTTDYTATYQLTNSNTACAMSFPHAIQ